MQLLFTMVSFMLFYKKNILVRQENNQYYFELQSNEFQDIFTLARLSEANIGTFDLQKLSVQELDFLVEYLNKKDKVKLDIEKKQMQNIK